MEASATTTSKHSCYVPSCSLKNINTGSNSSSPKHRRVWAKAHSTPITSTGIQARSISSCDRRVEVLHEAVGQSDEDVKPGATLIRSIQISLSYIIFCIYSFDIIYNFLWI